MQNDNLKFKIFFLIILSFGIFGLAESSEAAGVLRVDSANPRYFTDDSGKAIYLTGSHTWDNFGDAPSKVFDFTAYLNFLQSYNHNFIRMWTGTELINAIPPIYQRTGPGTALDGGLKVDLTKFNQAYFDRLRSRVIEARDRWMYVSVMLFHGDNVINEGNNKNWPYHFFNKDNNINGIDADTNLDNVGFEAHTLNIASITAVQEAYVRKVINTLNDLDNVIYEISNEEVGSPRNPDNTAWQYYWINYVKNYETTQKPKQHPVVMTAQWPADNANNVLFASPADAISPLASPYQDNPPAADGSKVIIADVDHIWPTAPQRGWVWEIFLRGMQPILMDWYHWGEPGWISSAEQEAMRLNMGYTLTYANKMNLVAMTPFANSNDCSTTYCLRNPGNEYLIYQPSSGSFTVNLLAGTYSYEWFNPTTGSIAGTGTITASGGSYSFPNPFSGEAVLYLKKVSTNPYCGDNACNGTEICSTCPADCGVCPSQNPIAWWKLDETFGLTASDSSGNGNTGTLVNGPVWTTGKIDNALNFDGESNYIELGDDSDFNITGNITLSLWFKGSGSDVCTLIGKYDNVAPDQGYFIRMSNGNNWDPGGRLTFGVYKDDTSDKFITTSAYNDGLWHFLAATYTPNGSSRPIIYIDGQTAAGTTAGSAITSIGAASGYNFRIGTYPPDITYDYNGLIDEVRVYNRALSVAEVQTLYSSAQTDTTPPSPPTDVTVN